MKKCFSPVALSLICTVLLLPLIACITQLNAESMPVKTMTLPSFTELAKKLTPVAVNISTTKIFKGKKSMRQFEPPGGGRGDSGEADPYRDFFGDDFFRRFFGDMPQRDYKQQSLGSGFIIDKEGYILTNNHVVAGADAIKVKLASEKEYDAKIIGRDEKTDIALIKITKAPNDLPVAVLGDSDRLEVGEWVMAIGNPFGLQETVTVGVVSAKSRTIGAGAYDDFIQTDASINPGNSGGPLFNLNGEVVGINTAIFSPSGGNIGIGFASPINMAKKIVKQLKEKGKVTRGWLGVIVQEVTPDLAKSFGLKEGKGALVADVEKGAPADVAGIKQGDVIVSFDGKTIAKMADLPLMVAETAVGKEVTITILREGSEKVFTGKDRRAQRPGGTRGRRRGTGKSRSFPGGDNSRDGAPLWPAGGRWHPGDAGGTGKPC